MMIRIALGLSILLLTACSSTSTETPEASQDQTSESSSASGGGEVGALCAPCPLEPGTYSAAPFEPAFTFLLEDEWVNDIAVADAGALSQQMGGIFWTSGVTRGTVGVAGVTIEPTAGGFVAFLQSLSATGMTVSAPTPTTVDLVEGQQIDVATNDVRASGLYFAASDTFNLGPGEKARFIVLDHAGVTVVLVLEAFAEADFDQWLETVAPVVESISWE